MVRKVLQGEGALGLKRPRTLPAARKVMWEERLTAFEGVARRASEMPPCPLTHRHVVQRVVIHDRHVVLVDRASDPPAPPPCPRHSPARCPAGCDTRTTATLFLSIGRLTRPPHPPAPVTHRHVVQRVVVHDRHVVLVHQMAPLNDGWRAALPLVEGKRGESEGDRQRRGE